MKKPVTKAQIREQLEKQVSDFIGRGGAVEQVQRGVSGRDDSSGPIKPDSSSFNNPRTERTYVPEVIAALESRRKPKAVKIKTSKRRPRKRIIYDDFGEPLRWEWEE